MRYLKAFGLIACGMVPAFGGNVTTAFSFDDGTLVDGSSNSSIQSYINTKLGAGKSVTVTGAVASNSYTGDGHVVGPGSGSTYSSLTLGTDSTGNINTHDMFITNIANTSTEIKMVFTGLSILSVSFDYEIFPDGSCPSGNSCGANQPDFTFKADGTTEIHTIAYQPTSGYLHSPASGSSVEQAAQYKGSFSMSFTTGVSTLEFMDWPATIGIDNLVITYGTPTPEPISLALTGTGLIGIYFLRRRKSGSTKNEPRA